MNDLERSFVLAIVFATCFGVLFGTTLSSREIRAYRRTIDELFSVAEAMEQEIRSLRAKHVPHPE